MDLDDLTKWRMRAPFFIITACLLPWLILVIPNWGDIQLANQVIVPVVALVGAFFYVGLNVRGYFWQKEIDGHLAPQIREALLARIPPDLAVSVRERDVLLQETFKVLTGVFWEAIDRDSMLRAQKRHFYANGIIYSTSVDVYLICALAGAGYIGAFIAAKHDGFLIAGISLFLVAILTNVLVTPRLRRRHQELSAEQLDLLQRRQADYIGQRYREIILAMRRSGRVSENS